MISVRVPTTIAFSAPSKSGLIDLNMFPILCLPSFLWMKQYWNTPLDTCWSKADVVQKPIQMVTREEIVKAMKDVKLGKASGLSKV